LWDSLIRILGKGESDPLTSGPAHPRTALSSERTRSLRELEEQLGHRFQNLELLEIATTHKSYAYENVETGDSRLGRDYESMEFLGDAILGFIISEYLYLTYPDLNEGDLSKIRSYLVSRRQLFSLSRELDLGKYLNLSKGEEKTGGRHKRAILADLFESIVAAIYLDGGLEPVREFIFARFRNLFERLARDEVAFRDHKSELQETLHGHGLTAPRYEVIGEEGPDHMKKFEVSVSARNEVLAHGSGRSKKEAEQQAARRALEKLEQGVQPLTPSAAESRAKEEPESG
jgi:ribonuclease-3